MNNRGANEFYPAIVGLLVGASLLLANPAVAELPWPTASPGSSATDPTAVGCLAEAVYFEARGEPRTGREAVAAVVMNRLHEAQFPKSVCGVVFQGAKRASGCQFTFACDGSRHRGVLEPASWRDSLRVADDALGGRLGSPVGDSTHYHALSVQPAWSRAMTQVAQIGAHRFYVDRGRREGVALGAIPPLAQAPPRAATFTTWGLQVAVVEPALAWAPAR